MAFVGRANFSHGAPPLAAVVMVNLGTPERPDTRSVRRYLAEFLADRRVIEIPRLLWLMILHGVILRIRPRRSAHAYQQVWTERGSPLRFLSEDLAAAVQRSLAPASGAKVEVHLAMRYGKPALREVLDELMQRNLRRLILLPMYPQYSGTTTASVFDAAADTLKRWRWIPQFSWISDYCAEAGYDAMLADRIRQHRLEHGAADHLLFSFHGIPERYLHAGDPYHCQCLSTARRTAAALGLSDSQWSVSFQSRVGRERWLSPYTEDELKRLPGAGVRSLDVICPAFAVDCLETLEEIAMAGRQFFLNAGGTEFRYVPALNAGDDHARWLGNLIQTHTAHWPEWQNESMQQLQRDLTVGAQCFHAKEALKASAKPTAPAPGS